MKLHRGPACDRRHRGVACATGPYGDADAGRGACMGRIPCKWIVAIVFVAGVFMDILDTTSVNVAIPTLAREFDATTSRNHPDSARYHRRIRRLRCPRLGRTRLPPRLGRGPRACLRGTPDGGATTAAIRHLEILGGRSSRFYGLQQHHTKQPRARQHQVTVQPDAGAPRPPAITWSHTTDGWFDPTVHQHARRRAAEQPRTSTQESSSMRAANSICFPSARDRHRPHGGVETVPAADHVVAGLACSTRRWCRPAWVKTAAAATQGPWRRPRQIVTDWASGAVAAESYSASA